MKKLHIGAILLGGLFVAPFQAALSQTTNVAYANESGITKRFHPSLRK